jgi:hypothetical protein
MMPALRFAAVLAREEDVSAKTDKADPATRNIAATDATIT